MYLASSGMCGEIHRRNNWHLLNLPYLSDDPCCECCQSTCLTFYVDPKATVDPTAFVRRDVVGIYSTSFILTVINHVLQRTLCSNLFKSAFPHHLSSLFCFKLGDKIESFHRPFCQKHRSDWATISLSFVLHRFHA